MKATVDYLFDSNRKVISFDGSDVHYPGNFVELKKCENVIIGEKIDPDPRCKDRYVMIDDQLHIVYPIKINHPSGGGVMNVLEIM